MAVVVALAGPYVVGERVRHIAVFAVAGDEVGYVVADLVARGGADTIARAWP